MVECKLKFFFICLIKIHRNAHCHCLLFISFKISLNICARFVDFFTTKNFQDHGHPCVSGDAPSVSVMPEQFIEMLLFL